MLEGLDASLIGRSAWPSDSASPWWWGALGSYFAWSHLEAQREKEALFPFNQVVLVHAKSRRPMRLTRKKLVRCRKVWNKRRRETRLKVSRRKRRGAEYLRLHPVEADNLREPWGLKVPA